MISIYVNNIRYSPENKCYFSTLSFALPLPDICGMVEFKNKTVVGRYVLHAANLNLEVVTEETGKIYTSIRGSTSICSR